MIDGGQDPVPDEPQITEEEFDLSDIMGEQLDAQVDTKEERLRQLEKQVKTCAYSKSCRHCATMHTTIARVLCEKLYFMLSWLQTVLYSTSRPDGWIL